MGEKWATAEEEEPGYWSRPPLSGLADCLAPKNKWQRQQIAEKGYIPQITYPVVLTEKE